MLVQGQVGPTSAQSVQTGATPTIRLGQQGDVVASQLHGRYYETGYRKALYTSATTSAQTVVAASGANVPTSYTGGLVLANPPSSTVNCVLNKVGIAQLVAQPTAAATVGIAVGQSFTALTGLTQNTSTRGAFVGQPAGQGYTATAATLPVVGTLQTVLFAAMTGAITTVPFQPGFFDLEGGIVLPPGGFAALYWSVVSSTTGVWASYQWEEIPV